MILNERNNIIIKRMIGDLFGVLIIALIVYFIARLYLKNKREGKDDYTDFNGGAGNIMY